MYTTCALTTTGAAKCWGENGGSGVLGNGTVVDNNPSPSDVVGLSSGVLSIAVGDANACAITTGGGLKCWGSNSHRQLEIAMYEMSNVPVDRREFPSNVVGVSVGTEDICIIMSDRQLKCWGQNWYGELGNGTTNLILWPFNVPL
jgi:alpha-tubulin suppressor-like RCC1 family protein